MKSLVALALLAAASTAQTSQSANWGDPFQGTHFKALPERVVPLNSKDCHGEFNKCTFKIAIDFDGDGKTDRAYMANAGSTGIIVVDFANRKRQTMVIASFRGPLDGGSYISGGSKTSNTIFFIQPEASMAEIRLVAGRPKIRWLSD